MTSRPPRSPERRPPLGRGLSALIPEPIAPAPRQEPMEVDLDLLQPNPKQPRMGFDEARLDELAASIKVNGVIQPVVVRRAGSRFEIVAGERRWRAAQRAGLLKIPVIVRDVPDEKLLEVALIENIQRENLNPIDEALAYRRLTTELGLTHEQVAAAVGKDRASISNYLRLLKLPEQVQALVAAETLSMGHARALLTLEDPGRIEAAARQVVARGLSVRDTEALVRRMMDAGVRKANIAVEDRGVLHHPVFKASTALINVRPLRTHHWAGIGGCLKNYIMFVSSPWLYHADACSPLATIWSKPIVKGKTRLNILSLIRTQFYNRGAHHFDPRFVSEYKGLLMGMDPVAVDAVGARLLQLQRVAHFGEDRPLDQPPTHIFVADTKYKLGVSDLRRIDLVKVGWMENALL